MSTSTRQFLVHCLRAYLAAEGTPLGTTLAEPVDWDSLIHLAAFHRVAPLLDRVLRAGGAPLVPAAARAELSAYARSLSHRSLFLTGELLRLLKQLEAQGLPAMPFKGPALSSLLYGDPALRHFDDLDILLRPQDMPAAANLVLALGYRPKGRHTFHDCFTLAGGNMELTLELHRDIMPEGFPLRLDLEGVWARREVFSLGGAPTATLAPEDLLLLLCVHASRHLWLRLQWLCDVAQLLRHCPTLDWEQAATRARAAGGERMLWLGLLLAHDVLGAPLPPELESAVRRCPPVTKLAGQVKRRLFEGPLQLFKPWEGVSFHLQLIDRARDRLAYAPRYWLQTIAAPKSTDWDSLPLPGALFPLYYLLRPVRLAGKYGRRALSQFYRRDTGT